MFLMAWLPNVVMADNGKLQAALDNLAKNQTRATQSTVYDFDLSTMSDADKTLTTTLEVRNGLHVRFINGTLTRTAGATGPMVRVTNSSTLEIGKDAVFFNNGTDHTPGDLNTPNTSPVVGLLKGNVIVSSNGQIRMKSLSSAMQNVSRTTVIRVKETDSSIKIEEDGCSVDVKEDACIDGTIKSSCETSKINVQNGFVDYINILGKSSSLEMLGGSIDQITSYSPMTVRGGNVRYVKAYACNVYLAGNAAEGTPEFTLAHSSKLCITSALNANVCINVDMSERRDNLVLACGDGYQLTSSDFARISFETIYPVGNIPVDLANLVFKLFLEENQVILKEVKTSLSDYLQNKINEVAANGSSSKNNVVSIIPARLPSNVTNVIDKMITIPSNCYVIIDKKITMSVSKAIPQDMVFSVEANAGIEFQNVVFDGSEITKWGSWFILRDKTAKLTVGTGCSFKIPGCGTEKYTQESNFSLCSGDGTFTYKSGVFSSLQTATKGDGNIMMAGGEIYSKSTVIQTGSLIMTGGSLYGGYGSSDYIVQTSKLLVQGGEIHSLKKNNIIFADCDVAEISGGKYIGTNGMLRVSNGLNLYQGSYTIPTIYMKKDAHLYLGQDDDLTYTLLGDWNQYTLDKYFITHVEGGLKQLNFVSLPYGVEPYFNPNTHHVKLWKKQQNLQDWLDNLPPEGADTKEPIEYPIPSGGIDADGPGTIGGGIQAILDGMGPKGGNLPFYVGDKTNFHIQSGTIVTMRNIDFILKDGAKDNGYIYVEGTLIIDININITRIHRLIRVLPGGRVIWKGGSGTGTDITKEFIYVEKGGTLEYYGGTISGGEFGFHGFGTIYIYDGNIGGTKYGGYTYSSGTTTISGGTISGGYFNGGITFVTGGTFVGGGSGIGNHVYYNGKGGTTTITGGIFGSSGSGNIYNDGNLNLGGDGYIYDAIYNGTNGRIYIIGKLNIIIRIHISITDIILDTPIILGGDGYVLTEEDIKHIQIVLPNGYSWKYNPTLRGIIITTTTGIDAVNSDDTTSNSYYDVSGRKIEKLQKGLNIVKSSDGKVKKVMVK